MNFLLIHIGNKKIKHLKYSLLSLIKTKNKNIYLVSSKIIYDQINNIKIKKKIKFIDISSIKKNKIHILFNQISNINKSWNDGFWNNTLERFFYLENISKKFKLKNIIHIENDVLIFENYQKYEKIFKKKYKIAYPLLNNDLAVPSIVYFSNSNYISKLCKFINNQFTIFSRFLNLSSKLNDMKILNKFYKKNKRIIKILPTLSNEIGKKILKKNSIFYENFLDFNCIFDAAAIGQKIDGVDRSIHQHLKKEYINPLSIFSSKDLIIKMIKRKPFLIFNNKKIKISNLHIHSKRLWKFI